jgi:putative N6-adenine-specific DNA methylase
MSSSSSTINLFVSCAEGVAPLLQEELEALGLKVVRPTPLGLHVAGSMEAVYTINYCSRLATRVLWPLAQFRCPDREGLYKGAKAIDWMKLLTLKQTFAIDANVNHPNLRNSLFAALVVKDAICDTFRDATNERPSIDTSAPDVQFNLFIQNGVATIALDTTGAPLYKRGYRTENSEAPLQETLASALLLSTHFSRDETFCDPLCGSGTFLIEAAMIATETPAGFFRKQWAFFHHPNFDEKEWLAVKQRADAKRIALEPGKIFGADKDSKSLALAQAALLRTGFPIELKRSDISQYRPAKASLLLTNPPYGKRLETANAYPSLGRFIDHLSPARAFVLTSSPQLAHSTGLRARRMLDLKNGGLPVSLFSLASTKS